jgi:beta-lactamase class A
MATSSPKKASNSKAKPAAIASGQKRGKLRPRKKPQSARTNSMAMPAFLAWLCSSLVIIVGISTLLGSAIAITNSFNNHPIFKESTTSTITNQSSNLNNLFSLVSTGREITPLTKQLQDLTAKYPQLKAGILIADIENQSYVNLAGTKNFSAASTIKLPILIAFFQEVDAGNINLDELLTMTKTSLADGAGNMQYQPIGKKFSAIETATNMIVVSDNTATNMLIERLGGAKTLNKKFADWGLIATKINQPLPDKTGTNTTSPEELSNLLLKLDRGELVSLASRDRILEMMKHTERNNLLPQGLDKGATIAHKTGTILSVLGDTGIIYMPNGKRYIASVLVKRPNDDSQAESLIQEISRTVYQYFQNASTQPNTLSQKTGSFLTE